MAHDVIMLASLIRTVTIAMFVIGLLIRYISEVAVLYATNIPINQTIKQLDYSLIELISGNPSANKGFCCYPELNKESSVNRAVSGILV
jgi:hypothetical protein